MRGVAPFTCSLTPRGTGLQGKCAFSMLTWAYMLAGIMPHCADGADRCGLPSAARRVPWPPHVIYLLLPLRPGFLRLGRTLLRSPSLASTNPLYTLPCKQVANLHLLSQHCSLRFRPCLAIHSPPCRRQDLHKCGGSSSRGERGGHGGRLPAQGRGGAQGRDGQECG